MFDDYIYTGDLESNFQIFSVREEVVSLGEKLEAKMVEVQASKNTVFYNQIYPQFFFTNKGEQTYFVFQSIFPHSFYKYRRAKIFFLQIQMQRMESKNLISSDKIPLRKCLLYQARHDGICQKRRELYSQCFDEVQQKSNVCRHLKMLEI